MMKQIFLVPKIGKFLLILSDPVVYDPGTPALLSYMSNLSVNT